MPTGRLLLLALALCSLIACDGSGARTLDATTRRSIVAALATQVEAHHVDAVEAVRIAGLLRAGHYEDMQDTHALARRLSRDTQLSIGTPAAPVTWWRRLNDTAGIARYDRIGADIGYIDITHFVSVARAAPRYARVFHALAGVRTLIVDLRRNGGGDAGGLQLLASYMVDRPIHYADLARRSGAVEARWAFPQLATRPYLEELTVLVGPQTSAEAENFAYAMQAWKRAIVVGSRSAGIATAGGSYTLPGGLAATIPDARVTLPLTRTNWEQGIAPDVVNGDDALKEAKRRILTDRLAHVTTPMGRAALLALLKAL